jgi:PAP2 superfamily
MRLAASSLVASCSNAVRSTPTGTTTSSRPSTWRELLLLLGLYLGYTLSRLLASDQVGTARDHARSIAELEHGLGIDPERWLNTLFRHSTEVEVAASYWYSLMHYVVTPLALFALYRLRPDLYRPLRSALAIATVAALAVYLTWPAAPPRLMGDFHDTLLATADFGWWSGHASAPEGLGATTNELAAMPSMHVGWAVWSSIAILAFVRARWVRVLVVLYPVITLLVVVGTANHWVLDAVAGAAITVAAVAFTTLRRPGRAPAEPSEVSGSEGAASCSGQRGGPTAMTAASLGSCVVIARADPGAAVRAVPSHGLSDPR